MVNDSDKDQKEFESRDSVIKQLLLKATVYYRIGITVGFEHGLEIPTGTKGF
jgi:hypothetical protein